MRFRCPHCGNETISVIDKFLLDPRHKKQCKECGGYINIPYIFFFTFFMIVFAIGYIMKFVIKTKDIFIIVVFALLAIAYQLIVIFFVPIIKDKDPSKQDK